MYTVQFWIAGYSSPEGTDVEYCSTLAEVKRALSREHDTAEAYGAGYEPSEVLVFKGKYKDVTDMYPDYQGITGPRGGVKLERIG